MEDTRSWRGRCEGVDDPASLSIRVQWIPVEGRATGVLGTALGTVCQTCSSLQGSASEAMRVDDRNPPGIRTGPDAVVYISDDVVMVDSGDVVVDGIDVRCH